jgi:NAD(P)-dependent dehydrogenase (short-subunit alcohol dehydrogenase family)
MNKKYALVTGSAKRLGKDIALKLTSEGYTVLFHYFTSIKEIEELKEHFLKINKPFFAYKADIKDKEQIKEMANWIKQNFGQLDLLVNNVGNYKLANIAEFTIEDWDDIIQSNLNGAFYCIHYLLELIKKSQGNIINIGYTSADSMQANVNSTAYSISKTGLLILSKSLAKSLGPYKVRVNMISPGHLENSVDLPANYKKAIPLQRPGTSDDIFNAILFILNNDYITGINLEVAGGYML